MLADNMKAFEYFKYLINEKDVSPEDAFLETIDFIKLNDEDIKEAYLKGSKDGSIESFRSASELVHNSLNKIADVLESIEDDEECDCSFCVTFRENLAKLGLSESDLEELESDDPIWDKIYEGTDLDDEE